MTDTTVKLQAELDQVRLERDQALYRIESIRELFESGDALQFLRVTYNNQSLDFKTRMRAAELALPYEKPVLKATILVEGSKGFKGYQLAEKLHDARLRLVQPPDDAA
jgi:hypothetical protein